MSKRQHVKYLRMHTRVEMGGRQRIRWEDSNNGHLESVGLKAEDVTARTN